MNPELPPVLFESTPDPPPPARRTPFWGWQDAAVFFGLAIPCLFLSQALGAGAAAVFHLSPRDPILVISAQTLAYALLFSLLAGILRMNYDAPFWRSLGWVPSRFSMLSSITAGVMLAFTVGLIGGLLHVQTDQSDIRKLLESPHGAVMVTVFAVTLGPLAEELAFRGFLQPLMVRSLGAAAGILIASSLFGLLHLDEYGRSWGAAAMVTLAGVGFGLLRHLTGSTRSSIVAHAAYNSTLFVAFFMGRTTNT